VAASVGQVVLSGVFLFGLYAYVRWALGPDVFGVWSVVVGTAVSAQLAGLGLAGSAVKFVAAALARGDEARGAAVAETTVVAVGALVGAACLVLYPALHALLPVIVTDPDLLPIALLLLPFALGSLWLNATASAILSCLDGASRVSWRAGLLTAGSGAFLALTVVLTPRFGVVGLASAQIGQNLLLVGAAWGLLTRVLPRLPLVPHRITMSLLRGMVRYGLSFQAISVLFLFAEPVTKAFVMRFGGAVWAGNFELANKLALQLRSVIVAGHAALVPMLATLSENAPERLRHVYRTSLSAVLALVSLSLPVGVAFAPVVSLLWLGEVSVPFVLLVDVLLVAWFVNALSGPAYFHYLGTGHLRWNVLGALATGATNVVLGLSLGATLGGPGAAVAYAAALVVGSSVPVWAFHRAEHPRALDRADGWLAGAGVGVLVAGGWTALLAALHDRYDLLALVVASALCWSAVSAWRHPLRQRLFSTLFASPVAR
jgi:O-antigen/teichoic acid export membrane protein